MMFLDFGSVVKSLSLCHLRSWSEAPGVIWASHTCLADLLLTDINDRPCLSCFNKSTMASEPYVEIFIDTLSFLSLEDASSNLHVELVRRDEGTATDAEALESAMRATVKRYWKNDVTLDLDSCRLKVNAYVPQTKAGAVDPMAKFKEDVAGLQDCKIVSVDGRAGLVRARDGKPIPLTTEYLI